MKLNDQQEVAANHKDGPCFCSACPGSGKTATLITRIERLITSGVNPYSIVAITFTNKAAKEAAERVALKLGEDVAKKVFVETFHRLCLRILRKHGHHLG